jgi:uncharacterized Zn finger protein (UPF0148 family)
MANTHCTNCGHTLVRISITRDSGVVTMESCSTCDTRTWHEEGRAVDRSRVFSVVGARS